MHRSRKLASLALLTVILLGLIPFFFYGSHLTAYYHRTKPSDSNQGDGHVDHDTKVTYKEPESEKTREQTIELFLRRPILRYEDAYALNLEHCNPAVQNSKVDAHAIEAWKAISDEAIKAWRKGIGDAARKGAPTHHTQGTGIVFCAGDALAVERAIICSKILRYYNCSLPIEVFSFPDELSSLEERALRKEGMQLRTVGQLEKGDMWKAFHIKAAAIQQCSFNQILYLDTDSYLLRDPTYLFNSPQYQKHGILVWPDFTKSHPSNPAWRLLGIPCRNEYEMESGQIIIDRTRHQDVLHVAEYMSQEEASFYKFTGGDRDSFRIAFLSLNKTWSGPSRTLATAGLAQPFGGHTMLQSDPFGKWTFVHANLIKHTSFGRGSGRYLWNRVTRLHDDVIRGNYGTLEGNERLGDGVNVTVQPDPHLTTQMFATLGGYHKTELIVEEEWNSIAELRDFERLYFDMGGRRHSA